MHATAVDQPRAGSPIARLRQFFKDRPDREHEMVVNRLVISVLLFAYLAVIELLDPARALAPLIATGLFFAVAVGFSLHLWRYPGVSVGRRLCAMASDLGALSYCMHVGDDVTALLFSIYLWVIFGNGFRFGRAYLFGATAVAIAGFGAVATTTPYWVDNSRLAIGLLAGLVVLPLYVSTLIRSLSKAKQQAEEASRSKSLFLASVSHELRTPLNAIIGMSDLIQDTPLRHDQRDMILTVRSAGRTLLDHINEILNFSRLEAGQMPTESVDFDLHILLGDVIGLLSAQARAKSLRLSLHVTSRTPHRLKGDWHHLHEILVNLATNAVKFTDRGGVVIAVDAVAVEAERVRLRLEVSDTGIGIAAEAQTRIFESFAQADETIINRYGGTGLGLAIVRQVVELHKGSIGVESQLGAGSTFWVELPIDRQAEDAEETLDGVVRRPIVVSRSADVLQAVDAILRPAGIEALLVGSVDEALALVEGSAPANATVVLDEQAVAGEIEGAASLLHAAGGVADTCLVLIADAARAALPEARLRADFRTVLARPVERSAIFAALRLSYLPDLMVEADRRKRAAATSSAAQIGRALRILVAEDNATNQKVITKILERAGHEAVIVQNGREALDRLEGERFDVALMDINMPVMSGIEAAARYRQGLGDTLGVPIIALTADATPDARRRCEAAGMSACLTKPIEPARLFDVIGAVLADREAVVPAPTGEPGPPRVKPSPNFAPEPKRSGLSEPLAHLSVDMRKLEELERLGGDEFVAEILDAFFGDTKNIVENLRIAVRLNDALAFRAHMHALRSCAANVGAVGLYQLSFEARRIDETELAMQGATRLHAVVSELDRVRHILSDYSHAPPRAARA